MVMLMSTVLAGIAATLLLTTTSRYQTTYQSASWQESIIGAESGIDLAMNELRKRVTQGPSASFQLDWTTKNAAGTTYPDDGHAFPTTNTQAYTLATHLGEGNTTVQARVYVDVPGASSSPLANFAIPPADAVASYLSQLDNPNLRDSDGVDRSNWWYRIRSVGMAGLSGPPRPGLDRRDSQLRHLSFFTDWRTGKAVASPQTARMVEVLAKPFTGFRNALMADQWINLNDQNVFIDSYDSSKGIYSATTNHGNMGNIATNGQLINANHAQVEGGAATNDGSVKGAENVTGQQSSNFYQEFTPYTQGMLSPVWSSTPDGGTLTANATYTASTNPSNPTRVRLDGINLPDGNHTIHLAAPPTPPSAPGPAAPPGSPPGTTATTTSYLKVFIDGDMITNGTSAIEVDSGVNVIVYITGNVNLNGDGLVNDSQVASHVLINGIEPPANPDGTLPSRAMTISTDQDFEGIIYAPNHDVDLNMVAAVVAGGPASPPGPAAPAGGPAKPTPPTPPAGGPVHAPPAPPTPGQQADHSAGYNGIYGAFVGKTITVEAMTHVHYDQTLQEAGPVNHYEIVNWTEDTLSHDTPGTAEQFWWPAQGN